MFKNHVLCLSGKTDLIVGDFIDTNIVRSINSVYCIHTNNNCAVNTFYCFQCKYLSNPDLDTLVNTSKLCDVVNYHFDNLSLLLV